jgi:hypothetical protein
MKVSTTEFCCGRLTRRWVLEISEFNGILNFTSNGPSANRLFCSRPSWTDPQTATVNVGDFANKICNTVFRTIRYESPWRQYKGIKLQDGAANTSRTFHSLNNTTNEPLIFNLKGQSSNTESGPCFIFLMWSIPLCVVTIVYQRRISQTQHLYYIKK